MVTVVDAVNLLRDYSSTDFIRDRGESLGDDDKRTMVDLLVEQIEFADVVVLNKVDDASSVQLEAARKIIRALNPGADIVETRFSNAPFERILNTGRFDFEKAQQHPLWFKELYGFASHTPETEQYGVSNFVYRARGRSTLRNYITSCGKRGQWLCGRKDIFGSRRVHSGWAN